MRSVIVVAFVACLLFAAFTDAAPKNKNKKNKNKDKEENVCKAQESALKAAGTKLCMMKRAAMEMMVDHAEGLECFQDFKEMAMDMMKDGNYTKEMGDDEDMDGDVVDDGMDDDEEDVTETDSENKKKNKKKNKKNKNKGGDEEAPFWEVDDMDMEWSDDDMDMMKNMTMRDAFDMMGPCKECKKEGCFRMNAVLGKKIHMMEMIFEKIEDYGGCDGMTTTSGPGA